VDEDLQDEIDAAWAEQELQERRYREEEAALKADPGYFDWLIQLAAEAALRTETNDGDHR